MAAPRITKDFAKKQLTVEKEFDAPLARVWSAWTTEEKLIRWWGPKEWPASSHSFDFRVGGHWHFSMTGPQGEKSWGLLRYTRIEPLTRLQAEDYFSDEKATQTGSFSRWDVSFQRLSATSTRVTTRMVCATEENLKRLIEMGFEAGYTSALDNLDQLVAGRSAPATVVSRDGTPLVYEKVGSGPPLILVGGALVTRTNSAHTELAAALAAQFTVFNYDRRGRGDSSDTQPYAVEREIEDLQALVEVAGGSAAVYGLSSGAILALRAALHGVKMAALVLYEPPFIVEPGDRRPPADSLEVLTRLVAQGRRAAAASYFMTKIFGMPAFVPLLMRLTPYWKPSVAAASSLPYDLTVVGDWSVPAPSSALEIPTLVVHGDQTQPLLIHAAQAVARTLPRATLKSLPGVNHQVATADLAPAVAEFLQGVLK